MKVKEFIKLLEKENKNTPYGTPKWENRIIRFEVVKQSGKFKNKLGTYTTWENTLDFDIIGVETLEDGGTRVVVKGKEIKNSWDKEMLNMEIARLQEIRGKMK